MTDLVERLRAQIAGMPLEQVYVERHEAADEIERLRIEVEQWRENDRMQREILAGAVP
jgi:hypothetical protein